MSNFDTGTSLRSQEFVQRSEMQSQALRQDSANQMVGGLQQTVEAARQFAMLKAEADARLQMHQQEMAINAVKLQHMQALDATDLMGHQVEAARLQNEAAAFEIEQARERAASWKKSGMDEVQTAITRAYGGGHGMLEQGVEWKDGKLVEIPAERLKQLRARASSNQAMSPTNLRMLAEELDLYPETAGAAKAIRDSLKDRALGELGINEPKAPPPAPAPDPKTEAEMVPLMRSLSGITKDPETQRKIVTAVWSLRGQLAAGMNKGRNKERRPTEYTEREAVEDFIQHLLNPHDPAHKFAWNVIRASGMDVPYVPIPEVR